MGPSSRSCRFSFFISSSLPPCSLSEPCSPMGPSSRSCWISSSNGSSPPPWSLLGLDDSTLLLSLSPEPCSPMGPSSSSCFKHCVSTSPGTWIFDVNLLWYHPAKSQRHHIIYIILVPLPLRMHLNTKLTSSTWQSGQIIPCHIAFIAPLKCIAWQSISIRMLFSTSVHNGKIILSQLLQPSWYQTIWALEMR